MILRLPPLYDGPLFTLSSSAVVQNSYDNMV